MTQTHAYSQDVLDLKAQASWSMEVQEPLEGRTAHCDILFLHGLGSGGWVWKDDFLLQFREAGYRVWTLTLPGRMGGPTIQSDPSALARAARAAFESDDPVEALEVLSTVMPGASLLDGPTIDEFSEVLHQAVASIKRPVAIVCHSLGGAVAQSHLRRNRDTHGVALICSVPPYGMWRASVEMAVLNPVLWKTLLVFSLFGKAHVDAGLMRHNLFPNGVSDFDFETLVSRLHDESLTATLGTVGFPPFAPMPGHRKNVLVMGSAKDRLVPMLDVMMTSVWYGTRPVILPNSGHMPMLEENRTVLAQSLIAWADHL